MGLHHRTDAYSTDSYHSIHVKPATQPTARLRPPPGEACHRRSAATLGGILLVRRRRAWLGRQGRVPAPEQCASHAGAATHHHAFVRRFIRPACIPASIVASKHPCTVVGMPSNCAHAGIWVCADAPPPPATRDLFFPLGWLSKCTLVLCHYPGASRRSGERVSNCVRCGTTPYQASMPAALYPMVPHSRAVS
jgi:hypothetical protein